MHPVGFEPTPPKRTELESVALDHSATDAYIMMCCLVSSVVVGWCACVCAYRSLHNLAGKILSFARESNIVKVCVSMRGTN